MIDHSKQLIRGRLNLRPEHRGSVVTIGAFDGVHLGHQAVIRQAIEKAASLQLPAVAVIFEPLPREYFQRSAAVARILPFREKVAALFANGIDRVLCLSFNQKLSTIEPQQFLRDILVKGLGVKYLVIGDDFRFGNKRAGSKEYLEEQSKLQGFVVESADTVNLGGERVSSTRIRALLAEGNFTEAEACLGRPFTIKGRVIYGKQLGRQLGVPTANVALHRLTSPVLGTFAGQVKLADASTHNAVINVGMRPTVNKEPKPLLEAHLLDFKENLYGQRISVEFGCKLRDEKKFESLDALKAQIQQDIIQARDFFRRGFFDKKM